MSKRTDYERTYADWIASMSPEERRQAAAMGLDRPDWDSAAQNVGLSCDVADMPIASPEPQAETIDTESLHLLRRLIGELLSNWNCRLSLECLALVTGLCYQGDSMTEIANRHRLTRAAVSKRCVELARCFNLPPSRAMKSEKARSRYRAARFNRLNLNR